MYTCKHHLTCNQRSRLKSKITMMGFTWYLSNIFSLITAHLRAHGFSKASVIVFLCISFAQINLKIQIHLCALRVSPYFQSWSVCAYLIFLFKGFLCPIPIQINNFTTTGKELAWSGLCRKSRGTHVPACHRHVQSCNRFSIYTLPPYAVSSSLSFGWDRD